MSKYTVGKISTALIASILAFASSAALADHYNWVKQTDGLTFRLGITPATYVKDHPELLPAGHPVVEGTDQFHVLVAVFDSTTGARLKDADVEATIGQLGFGGASKNMVPWSVNGMLTYCNFFAMSPGNVNVIDVRVSKSEGEPPITVQFTHTPFAG